MTYSSATDVKPHTVYRCYDRNGALLYVGCTVDVRVRLGQHGYDRSPWLPLVVEVTTVECPDRAAGLAEEKRVIAAEQPMFNTRHNKRSTQPLVIRPHRSPVPA